MVAALRGEDRRLENERHAASLAASPSDSAARQHGRPSRSV
jgi:hypothetical protein